jgi:hypothetical protein
VTEDEFNRGKDPERMLAFVRGTDKLSERKLRLFGCACCRRVWHVIGDDRSRTAVEVTERFADGQARRKELYRVRRAARDAEREAVRAFLAANDATYAAYQSLGYYDPAEPAYAAFEVARQASDAAQAALWAARCGARGYPEAPVRAADHSRRITEGGIVTKVGTREATCQCRLLRDLFGPLPFRPVTIPALVLAWNSGCVVNLATTIYQERALPSGTLASGRLAVLADALEEAGLDNEEVLQHLRQQGGVHVRGCWCVDLLLDKA